MVIVFSPDCDHCQHETRELVKHMDQFKKVQIMMVSAMDYNLIKQFYTEYGLAPYPNIIMGRDPGYFFGTFYHVRSFPSIYLYNKKGNFVKAFEGSIPLETIAASL